MSPERPQLPAQPPPPSSRVPAAPTARKEPSAGLLVVLGLLGVCCFPFGLVAGALGLGSLLAARREGRSPPFVAWLGLGAATLSLLIATAAVIFSVVKNAQRDDQVAALHKQLAGKREQEALALETACDLARLHYLAPGNAFYDAIECQGPLAPDGVVRKLEKVTTVNRQARTESALCLARGHRWYVLSVARKGQCPADAPEVRPATPKNELAFDAEEDQWRKDEAARQGKERLAAFDARVKALRDALDESDPDAELPCPALPSQKDGPSRIAFLDRRRLDAKPTGLDDWDFLTHEQLRAALPHGTAFEQRLAAADQLEARGPYLAVFDPDDALWPKVVDDDGFDFGELHGRLVLADFEHGKLLCAAPLDARSSKDVSSVRLTKLETRRHALERAVEKDFKKQLEASANAAMKELSGGVLELDFGLFD